MAAGLSMVSRILSNGTKAVSTTERFGKTIKTVTKILDKNGKELISRTKRTFPASKEFRAQDTYYHVGDNITFGVKKEFARLGGLNGKPKFIQEAVSLKNPMQQGWGNVSINNRYDWGSGYYA